MKKFKKLLSCLAATALAATSLIGGTSLSANANTNLLSNEGPFTGNATFIGNYPRTVYYQQSAFQIQFKYDVVGTPAAPQEGEPDVGYNDTFEFLVYDTAWGGWNRTTIGPNGYDQTSSVTPEKDKVYSVTVPISVIESKLAKGATPYGINLQTGAQLGTSEVTIVSLDLISGVYVQQPFTATGKWTKGTASNFTVDPTGAATVNGNEWNIEVTAIDLNAWTNPTIDVTVTYAKESVDEQGNYAQAEIMLPTGELDDEDNMIYAAVDPNYVDLAAGTYTFTTEVPNSVTSFIAAYDMCTVTEIKVYDNTEGNVTTSVTGKTAAEIAANMGVAWDLGNSLEASTNGVVNEKDWGNPKTTKKLIQAVKAAGFNTIRVPISYMNTIDGNNQIDDAYISRIQQVVKYAYDMGMYVIINIHNDGAPTVPGSWINISATGDAFEAVKNKFAAVWTDIANNFAGYDQRLVFEGANELMIQGNYTSSPDPAYANINALNQAFVEAVRNSGTNNADRVLIVTGYNTNIDLTIKSTGSVGFVKPTDPTPNRLMLSVHYYAPDDFSWTSDSSGNNNVTTWSVENYPAATYGSKAYMQAKFEEISAFADDLGMPVFLGEYGPEDKDNTAQRANYDYWLNYYAKDNGIVTAYWDNGSTAFGGSALFDRINNAITSEGQIIVNAIMAGYNQQANPSPVTNPTPPTT